MSETSKPAKRRRAICGAVLTCALVLVPQATAMAEDETPASPPEAPSEDLMMNDFTFAPDPEDFIHRFAPQDFIEALGGAEYGDREDEDNVIYLETDILFHSNEWQLPEGASSHIAELVEVVPEGASVEVNGHTDSLPVDESQFDFDNQELSENRAQAVADAMEEERPDLNLTVEGFGDSQPAVDEDEDDPSTFAANRRVEIRYD